MIGGSLAKAVAARHPKRILIGVEPSARTRRLASKDQIFDRLLARPSTELAACEIVVLCAPVPAILRLLGPVSRRMRRGALLSDVGGVKEPIAAAARKSVAPGIRFVGAHPMFGGGIGGYKAGRKDLWRGGAVAVCTDGRDPDAVSAAARFYRALGARVILTSAREHDAAVAVVSHLPYVIGSALALTARAAGPLALRLAGRGLVDVTRLAEFAFPIQGAAVRGNSHLSQASRRFQRTLRSLLRALSQEGSRGEDSFRRARKARMAFMEARAAALAGTRP